MIGDRQLRIDRQTRLDILTAAGYKCQLEYTGCSVAATEIADVGEFKAACKECRRRRDGQQQRGNRLAAASMKRTRPQ